MMFELGLVLLALAALAATASGSEIAEPAIIPLPVSMEMGSGAPFVLADGACVKAGRGVPLSIRNGVQRDLGKATKVDLSGTSGAADAITLLLDASIGKGRPDWQQAESYKLTVAKDGKQITIAAPDPHGLFNGIQTLVQLATKGDDGVWRIPSVTIDDYPRFQWRGYLIDPARHFRTKAELLRITDLLAMHKLNVLHLHLTDDQGWRLEIKRYPKLTAVGAAIPDYSGKTGSGWFYKQDEMKEIIAYAADRFITVVPEIEMPGHSTAATTAYPELSCNGNPQNALCVSKESTYEFMANVLAEVAALFPSPYIHIGADEVIARFWNDCPSCKKRMEVVAAGLPDGVTKFRVVVKTSAGVPFDEGVAMLEGDFVRRIDKHIAGLGKRMIGWDEILDGGLRADSRAIPMAWRSQTVVEGAAKEGRDVVVCVYPPYYLDNDTPLPVTYALEPAPLDLSDEVAKHILGVQGNMWGEGIPTQEAVDRRTYPRLIALAEIGWSPRESRNYTDFAARLAIHAEQLKPYGISFVIPKE